MKKKLFFNSINRKYRYYYYYHNDRRLILIKVMMTPRVIGPRFEFLIRKTVYNIRYHHFYLFDVILGIRIGMRDTEKSFVYERNY